MNFEKSEFTCSPNMDLYMMAIFTSYLGMKPLKSHSKYLGMPLVVGKNKKETFRIIDEKMERKVQDWKKRTLSWAGREIIIKACLQPIPIYMMNCFRLPKYICNNMTELALKFGGVAIRGINASNGFTRILCKEKRLRGAWE